MPVRVYADIRPLGQREFGEIAYRVMDRVFAVHNEMGRFLNEDIYRDAVSIDVGADAQTEVRVEVAFEEFRKDYFMDLLVDGHDVEVTLNGVCLGCQEVRLASPSWAFKVTTFDQAELPHFED